MKKKKNAGIVVVVAITAVMMLLSYAVALSPEEISVMALNKSSDVDYCKFDVNITIDVLMGNEKDVMELTIDGNGSGESDCVNESLWLAMNVNVNTSENTGLDASLNAILSMLRTIEMDLYLINNTAYSKVDLGIPFMPVLWIKMEPPVENNTYNNTYNESLWTSNVQPGLQKALLNYANVSLLEDDVVDDIDCYVLKFELEVEKLLEFLIEENEYTIDMANMSLTAWIAKDTKFVMKAEATGDMSTSLDTGKEATIATEFKLKFYDHNVPVSIVLPAEAESAIDVYELLDSVFNAILGIDFYYLPGMPG